MPPRCLPRSREISEQLRYVSPLEQHVTQQTMMRSSSSSIDTGQMYLERTAKQALGTMNVSSCGDASSHHSLGEDLRKQIQVGIVIKQNMSNEEDLE